MMQTGARTRGMIELAIALLALAARPAIANGDASTGDRPVNPWALATTPAPGPARAIGGTSAGCVRGAVALPLNGPGYQVMRPSRHRRYGHPLLVQTIRDLGAQVRKRKLGVLMIGDMGQVRGGPAPTGHKSHQSGLDVDIWYTYPAVAARRRLTMAEREHLEPRSLVDARHHRPTRALTRRVRAILELAARDERVDRIFVNPIIKRALCQDTGVDHAWLHKLRPWWGHSAHFHLRLACPSDSPTCTPQEPIAAGDGCDELDWWLGDQAKAARARGHARYREGIGTLPELPAECAALVE